MHTSSEACGDSLRALYAEAQKLIDGAGKGSDSVETAGARLYERFAEIRQRILADLGMRLPPWTAPSAGSARLEPDDLRLLQQSIYEACEALEQPEL